MSRKIGNAYEDRVVSWVLEMGWVLICRNWSTRQGEIDLVAQALETTDHVNKGEVIIIEVKGRQKTSEWHQELISHKKHLALMRVVQAFQFAIDSDQVELPTDMTGLQIVVVQIIGDNFDIIWNALDVDIG